MTVKIRDVKAADLPKIRELINETWGYFNHIEDKNVLDAVLAIYLNPVLHQSSFGKIAESDGEFAGVIFGSSQKDTPRLRMLQSDGIKELLQLASLPQSQQELLLCTLKRLLTTYGQLSHEAGRDYQGCLELFAVKKAAQGKQIGKKLLQALLAYFQQTATEDFYLYTDTMCNYGFYEHMGLQQKAARPLSITLGDHELSLNAFLYQYELPSAAPV